MVTDRRQWILSKLEIGDKILDIGSADGWIFRETPFQKYTTFVDIDKYDIPNFYQMSAEKLEFPDKTFDIAIVAELLEHVQDPVQVLREAKRVSKRILMTIPDEDNWSPGNFPKETLDQQQKRRNLSIQEIAKVSNPNCKEFYNDNYNHLFHQRYYQEDTLRKDLEEAGIKDYKLDRLTYGDPQWSFFTVDANTNSKDKDVNVAPISTGPVILYGDQAYMKLTVNSDKDRKLNIAIISTPFFTVPPNSYGGLEQVVWDLAVGLDELGHNVTLFAPENSSQTKHGQLITTGPSISNVNIDWFQEENKRYNIYKDLIIPDKFDIVHDHTWFAYIYLSKQNNNALRIIHTHHGGIGQWDTPPPFPKPNLVAISQFMKQYTENYFRQKGFNTNVQYVYNGINLSKYPYQSTKTDHLLFLGRLSTFKQPHVAIQVAKKTNHKLDLVGGTFVDSKEYLQNLENSIKDDPDIQLFKDADNTTKIEKLQNAKALIMPSKMAEPFGLTAIEAMSCGTPVIALDDGALKEIIIHNKTGFICRTEDEMIDAINNVHTIKSDDCRHRAEQFSRKIMAENYLKLYSKMMRGEDW